MTRMSCAMMAIAVLGLSACGSANDNAANDAIPAGELPADLQPGASLNNSATSSTATAAVRLANGTSAGTATAREVNGALQISLNLEGLPVGTRGVHVHMTGRCDAPEFTTAGAHWNPASMQHGLENPQGQHAGDMPNLEVGPDGRGSLEYTLKGATMNGLLDTDGSALVVHAGPDDQKTDPSGDSGSRIACGIFQAS
jgi:Cu-Zn family superoxide dismutase